MEQSGRSLIAWVGLREDGRRGSDCRVLKTLLRHFAIKEGREMGYWLDGKAISNGMCVHDRCDTIEGLDADEIDPVEEGNDC